MRRACFAAALVLSYGAASAMTLIIDDFGTPSSVADTDTDTAPAVVAFAEFPAVSAPGLYRDLFATQISGSSDPATGTSLGASGGNLFFSNSTGATGIGRVDWEGSTAAPTSTSPASCCWPASAASPSPAAAAEPHGPLPPRPASPKAAKGWPLPARWLSSDGKAPAPAARAAEEPLRMTDRPKLRSQLWFDNPHDREMTALYLERYLNYGLTRDELQSGKPIIAIAQTGSDLSPCNRHHIELAKRVRDGVAAAGGTVIEVPVHPIQETGKRPTAMLDRNLAYLSLVETLFGYPLDGVVLMIGCDKTTPALLMAAATVGIPAIALSVGPMLNGWFGGKRVGSGTIVWKAREMRAAGEIDDDGFMEMVAASTTSVGYCSTMGTATTMNSLAEALGMQLPGAAAIPAAYRERGQIAYHTGRRIVEMVREDLTPAKIMTREAFENAIVVNSAIGGSTNAPIHLNAIARHLGVPLDNDDWQRIGLKVPLLVNLQPAGEYLGEDYHRAGGVPAVVGELMAAGLLPHPQALTANGAAIGPNCAETRTKNADVIRPASQPLVKDAGFLNLKGNLFDSALMKTSVISPEFRKRYLSNPDDPNAFEGRAVVFDGPEDFHARIDDESLGVDAHCILVMRGAGPIGYPGGAEVVNMRPPAYLLKQGITALPCLGDGRQSGTSGSPSILNASPEAADRGGLALLRSGDRIRIDLEAGTANMLVDVAELAARRAALPEHPFTPESQTPWQEIFRARVQPFAEGMTLAGADAYRDIAAKHTPRDNH